MDIALTALGSPRRALSSRSALFGFAVLFVLFAVVCRNPAQAADGVIWVGTAPACTHADLQTAIDAASRAAPRRIEVRLSHDIESADTLRIRGGDIRITGGWAGCRSHRRLTQTTLSGGGQRGVVEITAAVTAAGRRPARVEMHGVRIVDGAAPVGGGIHVRLGSTLRLYDSDVVGNTASLRGGGIALSDGSALEMAGRSRVVANAVQGSAGRASGGGIACLGAGEVYLGTGVEVGANQAVAESPRHPSRGGGIFLADRCSLVLSGGVRIEHNRSVLGAGVFAGADVRGTFAIGGPGLDGVPRLQANRLSNFGFSELGPMGGALFLGPGARIEFERLQAVGNGTADPMVRSMGGAFALQPRAEFIEIRNPVTTAATTDATTDAPRKAIETELHGNRAGQGGFAFVADGARLELDASTASGLDVATSERFGAGGRANSAASGDTATEMIR